MTVVAAIVAGGLGRRMGGPDGTADKPWLELAGVPIIERQLVVLRALFPRVLVAVGAQDLERNARFAALGVATAPDRVPGVGPLAGLDAVLAALLPGENAVVCVGGDMPFLHAGVLTMLRDEAPAAQAVVARVANFPEPLCARYHQSCAPHISARLARGAHKTSALLDDLRVTWLDEERMRRVDPELVCLTNVNTPEDLARVTGGRRPARG